MAARKTFKSSGRRLDEAPETVRYFTIVASGDPQGGATWRVHHVGAASEDEAVEIVDELEARNAEQFETATWSIESIVEGDANVPHPEDVDRAR